MSAKEMFEKLDYKYFKYSWGDISYSKDFDWVNIDIWFDIGKKEIQMHSTKNITFTLSIEELQAINKQIEELGWE